MAGTVNAFKIFGAVWSPSTFARAAVAGQLSQAQKAELMESLEEEGSPPSRDLIDYLKILEGGRLTREGRLTAERQLAQLARRVIRFDDMPVVAAELENFLARRATASTFQQAGVGMRGAGVRYRASGAGKGDLVRRDSPTIPLLSLKVAAAVKAKAIAASSAKQLRHSPSATAMEPDIPLTLQIDLNTGEILEGEACQADVLTIRFLVYPHRNKIVFDRETADGLQKTWERLPNANHRAVMEGVLLVVKDPVLVPGTVDRPLLEAGRKEADLLLEPDPALLETNLEILRRPEGPMTINAGMGGRYRLDRFEVGTIALDGDGRIVNKTLGRPREISPRGTVYATGVRGAGATIAVVLYKNDADEGRLVWVLKGDQPLNAAQEGMIAALLRKDRAAWEEMEANAPGSLNRVLRSEGFEPIPLSKLPQVRPSLDYFAQTFLFLPVFARNDFHFSFGLPLNQDLFLADLVRAFDWLYGIVIAEKTLNVEKVKGLRSLIFLIQQMMDVGYSIPLDSTRFSDAKEKLKLGSEAVQNQQGTFLPRREIKGMDQGVPSLSLLAIAFDSEVDFDIRGLRRMTVGGGKDVTIAYFQPHMGKSRTDFSVEWEKGEWILKVVSIDAETLAARVVSLDEPIGTVSVNEEEVEGSVVLKDGDRIEIGYQAWIVRLR